MDTTRDRLIEAAARLLGQGGPAAVTIREVGRLAGVSHIAPYKHFAGKQQLLAAVAATELGRRNRGQKGRTDADDGTSVLRQMMRSYVRWAIRHPARFRLTFGSWPADLPELAAAAGAARAGLVRAVRAAQDAGTLPGGDAGRVAALILATAHGAADLVISGHLAPDGKGHGSAENLVDDLLDYLGHAATART